MSTHREPDPEGDIADAPREISQLDSTCPSCGGPLDEDDECPDPTCPNSPYHLDEVDDDDDEENPFA